LGVSLPRCRATRLAASKFLSVERMYGKPLDLLRLNADHPVDLIVGGSPDQSLRMLHESINKGIGASLRQAAKRAGLQPGDAIASIRFE
jgi:hypothetical protein